MRGALPPALQRQLVVDSLMRFSEPPNHTTHTRAYPGGLPGIWAAAQQGLRLQQPQPLQTNGGAAAASGIDGSSCMWGPEGDGPTAQSLLRRLRWATLGPPYDWTQRLYLREVPRTPLPELLREVAVTLADLAVRLLPDSSGSDMAGPGLPQAEGQQQPPGVYSPDATLVNFYYEGVF